jgi:ABC-2 type transport system ATP-binding protein
LVLDEPVNGLDPEGIHWIRNLMKRLAGDGRTVFVSSHLMNEMAVTADHLVVIGRGRLIADCPTAEFIARSSHKSVRVVGGDRMALTDAITAAGGQVVTGVDGALTVTGLDAPRIGEVAARGGLVLHELTPERASLEEAFMELTHDSVEFGVQAGDGWPGAGSMPSRTAPR